LHRIGWGENKLCVVLVEDDEADPVSPLVGVCHQGHDGALRGFHPLRYGHAPTGIHHEQNEVGGATDANLLPQILFLEGQSELGPIAVQLVGRGRAQRGVKSEIGNPVMFGEAGLDIAPALAVCFGAGTPSRLPAREAI